MDCEWTLDEGCLGDDWETLEAEVRDRAATLAVDTLRRLTAYRVGGCPITVRPATGEGHCFVPNFGEPPGFSPGMNTAGHWVNNCGLRARSNKEVALPPPVGRVDEVKVDGVVIASSNYRLDNGNLLTWVGPGDPPWPVNQDVYLPDTEEGTFAVTYLNAYPVDSSAQYAAGVLAKEYAAACTSGKCRLPKGVTTIVRQGITMEINSGAFPGGLTGIREVDAFIALWNPKHRTMVSSVWSPDLNRPRVTG